MIQNQAEEIQKELTRKYIKQHFGLLDNMDMAVELYYKNSMTRARINLQVAHILQAISEVEGMGYKLIKEPLKRREYGKYDKLWKNR